LKTTITPSPAYRSSVPLYLMMISPMAAWFIALVTISGNTNINAPTNGQSLHTRRHWFAAKNPSWRSRTRSWTPHGTPPKGATGRRVKRKKMQIWGLYSRRAKALTQLHSSCGICSWRGPIHPTIRVRVLRS
jgi:hypothetical protein